jgi:type I site-specific restriction endonuclease
MYFASISSSEDLSSSSALAELALIGEARREVEYPPKFPIKTFDFIVVVEYRRSNYNVWR